MKKFNKLLILLLILSILTLSGCGDKSGSTIDEPEITSDYLQEEYSQQLITDGAETIIGYVDITKDGDTYKVHVSEQEVVPNSNYDKGYYIADTNLTKDLNLGFDARIVCNDNGKEIVSTADAFIGNHPDGSDYLYTVYFMGDSAELILVTDPKEVIVK